MKTQIIKNCCSTSYLGMMKLQAEQSENWTFKFPLNTEKHIPIEEKFPKLSLMTTEVVKENESNGTTSENNYKLNLLA